MESAFSSGDTVVGKVENGEERRWRRVSMSSKTTVNSYNTMRSWAMRQKYVLFLRVTVYPKRLANSLNSLYVLCTRCVAGTNNSVIIWKIRNANQLFYFYQLFRLIFENNYHASQQHHRNHDSHCDASDVPLLVPIDEVQLERQEQIYCKNDREKKINGTLFSK